MSADIITLPTNQTVEAAWERYAELARALRANPDLRVDRGHCEALVLAWAEWRDLFVVWARK